jgi:hypothetical protein
MARQVRKASDFLLTHFERVTLVVEQNEMLDPLYIGFRGTQTVVLHPDFGAHAVK